MAWTSIIIDRALLEPVHTLDVQLWTQLKAAVYYLALFDLPVNLSVEHQFSVSRSPEVAVLLSSLLLLSLAGGVLRLKKLRIPGLPGPGGRGCCLPPSSFSLVLVDEHRLYLAGVGFAVTAASCLWQQANRGTLAVVLVPLYTIFLVAGSLRRGKPG